MKVGYIQFKPIFGKKDKNLEKIREFLEKGANMEADLLVLPEMCNTGYVFKSRRELESLSENIPYGPTTEMLIKAASEWGMYIVAGLPEKSGKSFFNSAILVGPEGFIALYRKAHLFNEEKLWFSRGNTPFQVHVLPKARVGMMICFDWFFPEVARILSLKGAQIICHPSNLVLPYCQKALLGSAIQNRVYIITANRVGVERGVRFTGMSQIISPNMKVIAKSGKRKEEIRVVEIDPKNADRKNITPRNNLWSDRRIDLYGPLLEKPNF